MSFWDMVNKVMNNADILIMVLDSRMINDTRNDEIERKIQHSGKPLIYVLNKSDLVDEHTLKQYKRIIPNSIFLSAKLHQGTNKLREKIMIAAARINKEHVKVGVLGYPNVGKSSVINALKGRAAAKTSSISGYTKSLQKIRSGKIMLLDTPGVIPYKEKDDLKHNIIGTIDYSTEKNPDIVAMQLMNEFPGVIEKYYGINISEDKEESLETIAKNKSMRSRGSELDIRRAAVMILKDWQTGKIKVK